MPVVREQITGANLHCMLMGENGTRLSTEIYSLSTRGGTTSVRLSSSTSVRLSSCAFNLILFIFHAHPPYKFVH